MTLDRTPSTIELMARALSHVAFPGEAPDDTLGRISGADSCGNISVAAWRASLLRAGVESCDVAALVAKRGADRISLAPFMGVDAGRGAGLELALDSLEMESLFTDDEEDESDDSRMMLSPAAAGRPTDQAVASPRAEAQTTRVEPHAQSSGEWNFVTASACRDRRQVGCNLLGEGTGCAGVFKLTSPTSGVSFAVKKIARPHAGSSAYIQYARELQILHALRHPGVCRLHAVVPDAGYHLLVLSLCEQGDLFEHVLNGSIATPATAREYFVRIQAITFESINQAPGYLGYILTDCL